MPPLPRRWFAAGLFAAAAAAVLPPTPAADPKPGKTVRLVTIGNSFSQNATRHLADVVKAGGHTLVHKPLSIGGASMQVHWDKAEKFEKDPTDAAGLYGTKKSLQQELAAGPWDAVTIQQASIKSHDVETYRPYAGKLAAYVRKHAPGATLYVHETWAYRVDDPRFSPKEPKPGEPTSRADMYKSLAAAYRTIAKENGAKLIPVGAAFDLADTDAEWGYKPDPKFDRKVAKPPMLPDQKHSLHAGYRWSVAKGDAAQTLGMDGHHANLAGEYLGACVFYEVLFGESVLDNPHVPKGLDPADAKYLRGVAHKAVEKERAATKSP